MPYTFSSVYSAGWSRDRLSSSFSTAARTPAAAAVDASGRSSSPSLMDWARLQMRPSHSPTSSLPSEPSARARGKRKASGGVFSVRARVPAVVVLAPPMPQPDKEEVIKMSKGAARRD